MAKNKEEILSSESDEEPPSPPKDAVISENLKLKRKIIELKKASLEKDKRIKKLEEEIEYFKNQLQESSDEIKNLTQEPYRRTGIGKNHHFFCNVCSEGAPTVTSMVEHIQTCNPKALKFQCNVCG